MTRVFAVVGVLALMAGFALAVSVQNGTQPGQVLPGPFRAFVITGTDSKASTAVMQSEDRENLGDANRVNKFHDLVTRYGLDPVVAVFAREIPAADQPLAKLLQVLDQAVEKDRPARLHAFGIFLTLKGEYFQDESWSAQIKEIEGVESQLKLKNVPLALDKSESERTKAYEIGPGNTVVILAYINQTVQARFEFTAEKKLDDAATQTVVAEIKKLVASRQ